MQDLSSDALVHVCSYLSYGSAKRAQAASAILATMIPKEAFVNVPYLYVCGGYSGSPDVGGDAKGMHNSLERFDLARKTWEKLQPMLNVRAAPVGGIIDGRIYIAGGFDGHQNLNTAECYDPELGCWKKLPPMATRRFGANSAVVGSRLYVCGGNDGNGPSKSVECFDPKSGQWVVLPDMRQRRVGIVCAALEGKLYACGGRDGIKDLKTVESLDVMDSSCETASWVFQASMGEARFAAAGTEVSGRFYVCGGKGPDDGLNLTSMEVYDPVRKFWEALPSMSCSRFAAWATSWDGSLYVCGGLEKGTMVSGNRRHTTVEVFDPETGCWSILPEMSQRRGGPVCLATR